jgi:cytochrome c556
MTWIDRSKLTWGMATLLIALIGACAGEPEGEPQQSTATVEHAAPAQAGVPLKIIMAGLATDMTGVATGLWAEDISAIAGAAGRIADHPRVPPEQMVAIQAELGEAFSEFVAFDQLVHDQAVELREAALAAQPMADLASTFAQVTGGCVACHTTFRARISSTLAAASPGS